MTIPELKHALSVANGRLADQPYDPELLDSRDRLKHQMEDAISRVEGCKERVRAYMERKDFESALDSVEEGLRLDSEDPTLIDLENRIRRRLRRDKLLNSRSVQLLGIALLVITLASAGHRAFSWVSQPNPVPRTIQVSIASEPSGAHIIIGNQEGTTPFVTALDVPADAQEVTYQLQLPNYVTYKNTLLLEPDRMSYVMPPVSLVPAGSITAEELYERASEISDRLKQMSHEEAGFADALDQFIGLVNRLQAMDSASDEVRDKGFGLRNELKANFTTRFESLPAVERNGEMDFPLLSALNRLDPEDVQTQRWMAEYPSMIGRLKREIEAAVQNGAEQSVLDDLASEEVQIAAMIDRAAPIDRPAPPAEAPPIPPPSPAEAPPVPPSSPVLSSQPPSRAPSAVETRIAELFANMAQAFSESRYILPKENSSAYFSSEIMRLADADSAGIGPGTRALVDQAQTFATNSARFAERDASVILANELTSRFAQALLSRESAMQVLQNFERAQDIWEAVDSVAKTTISSQKLQDTDARITTLRRLLEEHTYDVRRGSCNGKLNIDGFSIAYTEAGGTCESFRIDLDAVTVLQDSTTVGFKSTQSAERWTFEASTGDSSSVKEGTAREIVDTVRAFARMRESWNK